MARVPQVAPKQNQGQGSASIQQPNVIYQPASNFVPVNTFAQQINGQGQLNPMGGSVSGSIGPQSDYPQMPQQQQQVQQSPIQPIPIPQPLKQYTPYNHDTIQYVNNIPVPQVQFVPCMCPITVNVAAQESEKRLDEPITNNDTSPISAEEN